MAHSNERFSVPNFSIQDFIDEQENKNTISKTRRDVALLKTFLLSQNETRDIETIQIAELDNYLSNFLIQVRKRDGEEYEPSSLRSFISSFDRYLKKKNYGTTIIEGKEFKKTTEVLTAKQKMLKKLGKGNKPNAARVLTDEEVDILYGKNLLGHTSPDALINTLWLNNTQHFGMRGCKEHRDLSWGDIEKKQLADGTTYLEYNERQTKTRTGSDPRDSRAIKPKMFAVPGSERDPIHVYDLYASKRPDEMKNPEAPFYLAINHTKTANSTKPWFKMAPMGENKLNSLMKTMADKAGLDSQNLTNHSGRKRMIQKLNDQGVPPTHIIQISGHKNVQSLNNYSQLSVQQQRRISNTLSGISEPGPSGYQNLGITNTVAVATANTQVQSSSQQPLTLLQNATIQGGTFHISINALNTSPILTSEHSSTKKRRYVIESDSE